MRMGKWGKLCSLEGSESPGQVFSSNFVLTLCAFTAFSALFLFSSKKLSNFAWFVSSYQPYLQSVFSAAQDFILLPFWNCFPISVYAIATITIYKTPNAF